MTHSPRPPRFSSRDKCGPVGYTGDPICIDTRREAGRRVETRWNWWGLKAIFCRHVKCQGPHAPRVPFPPCPRSTWGHRGYQCSTCASCVARIPRGREAMGGHWGTEASCVAEEPQGVLRVRGHTGTKNNRETPSHPLSTTRFPRCPRSSIGAPHSLGTRVALYVPAVPSEGLPRETTGLAVR